jgi:acetolactate synthase-1/3 small subunit
MIKVSANHDTRTGLMQIATTFRGRVVDLGPDSLIIEVTGTEDKIDSLLEVLKPYGVLEMVRTGRVAMSRGLHVPQYQAKSRSGVTEWDHDEATVYEA